MTEPFRILSIDGGGIRGVLPAAFLAALEKTSGVPTRDRFDLIAGTSTGGIIALGLGLGFSAEEMLDFYRAHGPRIFPSNGPAHLLRSLMGFLRRRYDAATLRSALATVFGERRLAEATPRLVIPASSAQTGDVYIYKTPHHPRLTFDGHELVVDIAMATAAAPTYFSVHRGANGIPLIDGGLWANNPIMVAVVEAMAYLQIPASRVRVLSLGTGERPMRLSGFAQRNGGGFAWMGSVVEWILHGQSVSATNQARLLVGKESVVRVQPVLPRHHALDDASGIDELIALGCETARGESPKVARLFPPTTKPTV